MLWSTQPAPLLVLARFEARKQLTKNRTIPLKTRENSQKSGVFFSLVSCGMECGTQKGSSEKCLPGRSC